MVSFSRFKIRNLLIGCVALVSTVGIAVSAGLFWGYPIVGQGTYCISYQNPTVVNGVVTSQGTCTSTAPAGPTTLTGNELVVADTQLPGGQNPQTVLIPTVVMFSHGQGSERNALIGGDFQTNLWQRGTSFASATPTTAAYTADRWASYSSGNTVTINRQTGSTDISPTLGVNAVMRVVRPSGTNTTSICVGQILPTAESARFVGNEAIFSWYGFANTGYLQTNQTIIARIYAFTSADSATPNTNTDAMFKETLTNQTIVNGQVGTAVTTASLTAPAVIPLTNAMARYSVAGQVPLTIGGTAVTGVGVTLCTGAYPASTGVAGDWFEFGNAQLESSAPPVVQNGVTISAGNTSPGSFARRTPWLEGVLEQTYSYVITEGAASVGTPLMGTYDTTTTCELTAPVPHMRIAPTLAFGGTTLSASTWAIIATSATPIALATTYLVQSTLGANTINSINITSTTAAKTAGFACKLVGAGGGATIVASSEP